MSMNWTRYILLAMVSLLGGCDDASQPRETSGTAPPTASTPFVPPPVSQKDRIAQLAQAAFDLAHNSTGRDYAIARDVLVKLTQEHPLALANVTTSDEESAWLLEIIKLRARDPQGFIEAEWEFYDKSVISEDTSTRKLFLTRRRLYLAHDELRAQAKGHWSKPDEKGIDAKVKEMRKIQLSDHEAFRALAGEIVLKGLVNPRPDDPAIRLLCVDIETGLAVPPIHWGARIEEIPAEVKVSQRVTTSSPPYFWDTFLIRAIYILRDYNEQRAIPMLKKIREQHKHKHQTEEDEVITLTADEVINTLEQKR